MKRFFAELARRQVFRVAAAYAIVGWLLLQIVGLLAPNLGLPDWTVALVFIILIVGFPLAMLLTWAFEMTPEGVKRTEASGTEATASLKGLDIGLIGAALLVVLVSITVRPNPTPDQTVTDDAPSRLAIAVLPFADMSPEGNQDWFSDGISEEIIHRLAQVEQLSVAGRTPSFYFRNHPATFDEIGRVLKVGSILEGSVRKEGERLRITAQLIDIESGAHRWSGTFDRELKDIFKVQEELSISIATELLREMGLEPEGPAAPFYEPKVEAYQLLLRGRQLYADGSHENITAAARTFREAADLDSGYPVPLADLVGLLAYQLDTDALPLASSPYDIDAIVQEALARNPSEEGVLYIKANHNLINGNLKEAERYYREWWKISVVPGKETAFGWFLLGSQRAAEAIPLLERGIEVSPLDVRVHFALISSYAATSRFEKAERVAANIRRLGLSPGGADTVIEAIQQFRDGRLDDFDNSVRALDSAYRSGEHSALFLSIVARRDNDQERLSSMREALQRDWKDTGRTSQLMLLALLHVLAGNDEVAMTWYKLTYDTSPIVFRKGLNIASDGELEFLMNRSDGRSLLTEAGYKLEWIEEAIKVKAERAIR